MLNDILKVLIADDSSTIRRFVCDAIQVLSESARFVEAVDGIACLQQLQSGEFDIAFVDVNMPGVSGLEAVAQARQGGLETFVVLMSTDSDSAKLEEARNLGAYEYLAKPFEPEDIGTIISNYFRLQKQSSVMLVDDSAATRHVIRRVMEDSNFQLEIDEMDNGATALAAYQSAMHDIVFLDINMPGIDGIDTMAMLRKINPDVRVVLITTDRSGQALEALGPDQSVRILHKPFFAADVDRALHDLFNLKVPSLNGEVEELAYI